jgi:carboxyl-terminal processing protease
MKKRWIYGLLIVFISTGFISAADHYFEISRNLDVFTALFKDVNASYVDDTDPSKLMRTCIDGMLKTLDPFTNYISESQIETYRIQSSEKIVEIGIHFQIMDSTPVVTDLIKDLPADKSGLQIGDKILALDGQSTRGKTYDEVTQALRGQTGSPVTLSLQTIQGESKDLTITRQEFQQTNVPFAGMLTKDIGCINLKIFNPNAGKDVREAYEKLKKEHPELKGVILDLRGNPGGLLNEAVNVVNVFVEKNKLVVTTKGRVSEWNSTFKTLNEPTDTKVPVVVITDGHSASASEIVSGCMQDYDRGVVLGQRTYGKGLVQITKNLSYNTMLKVTTAKYYIPSGRCIQAINYAERNDDGSVKRIPDSLKHAFKTADGRKVWDGGGIDPDLPIAKPAVNPLIEALANKNVIFDYATKYKLAHDHIASAADFKISDRDYEDFMAFAKTRDYSYKTESDKLLEKLKEAATEEKYYDAVKSQYEDIKKKLEADKQTALLKNKAEITALIENEICGRYYYLNGKIEKSLQNDPLAIKAIELLNNPQGEYKDLLTAKK